jgi:hypothetical protein
VASARLEVDGEIAHVSFDIDATRLARARASDQEDLPVELEAFDGRVTAGIHQPVANTAGQVDGAVDRWVERNSAGEAAFTIYPKTYPKTPAAHDENDVRAIELSTPIDVSRVARLGVGAFLDFDPADPRRTPLRAWLTRPQQNLKPLPEVAWQSAGRRRGIIGGGGSVVDLNGKSKPLLMTVPDAFKGYAGAADFIAQLPRDLMPTGHALVRPMSAVTEDEDAQRRGGKLRLFHGTTPSNAAHMLENAGPGATPWLPRIASGFFTTTSLIAATRFSALQVKKRTGNEAPAPEALVVLEVDLSGGAGVVDLRGLRGSGPPGAAVRAYQHFKQQVESGALKLPELDAFEAEIKRRHPNRQYLDDEARQLRSSEQAFAHLVGAQVLWATGSYSGANGPRFVDEMVVLDPSLITRVRWLSGAHLSTHARAWS